MGAPVYSARVQDACDASELDISSIQLMPAVTNQSSSSLPSFAIGADDVVLPNQRPYTRETAQFMDEFSNGTVRPYANPKAVRAADRIPATAAGPVPMSRVANTPARPVFRTFFVPIVDTYVNDDFDATEEMTDSDTEDEEDYSPARARELLRRNRIARRMMRN